MMTAMKKKVYDLARKHGCEILVHPSNRIECVAPAGKVFRSCDSSVISCGGDTFGVNPPQWKEAYAFFAAEIAQGFEPV